MCDCKLVQAVYLPIRDGFFSLVILFVQPVPAAAAALFPMTGVRLHESLSSSHRCLSICGFSSRNRQPRQHLQDSSDVPCRPERIGEKFAGAAVSSAAPSNTAVAVGEHTRQASESHGQKEPSGSDQETRTSYIPPYRGWH